jgi:nucleotide-binding universal stress UspA family protein/RimJ/RimL family protein N-acetyltransferase
VGERFLTTRLLDGRRVEIRPLEPADRQLLKDGFERLSPESRYRRFFGPMTALRERDLDYLTQVDHHDHEALVALDPATGEGIGVARFVRTDGEVAEPAIVVADDWQGRGVGTRLLDALVQRAREEGVARFEAPVLAANADAIHVLERLGETTRRREGREVLLTIELPEPATGGVPWRALLSQFAAGALEPARTVLDRLWPRRLGEPGDLRANVIVVGTDGSPHAGGALEVAADLARLSGARLEIVAAHGFLVGDAQELRGAVGQAAERLRASGVAAGEHVRRGDPALVLTDVADEQRARLIVVGAGERTRAARRLIGSVADAVAQRSPCDVLIVRPR